MVSYLLSYPWLIALGISMVCLLVILYPLAASLVSPKASNEVSKKPVMSLLEAKRMILLAYRKSQKAYTEGLMDAKEWEIEKTALKKQYADLHFAEHKSAEKGNITT